MPDDDAKIVDLVLHFLYKLDYEDTITITTFQDEETSHDSTEMVVTVEPTSVHQSTTAPDNDASALDIQTETPELGTWNSISLSSLEVCIYVLFPHISSDNTC